MRKVTDYIWKQYSNSDWLHKLPMALHLDKAIRLANVIKAYLLPAPEYRICHWRVAVTNACNAACVFCAYPLAKLRKTVMKNEVLLKAVKLFDDAATDCIDLTPAIGDPLLDPKLQEKVMILNGAGYLASFTTNGLLLDRHIGWLLGHSSGIDHIHISVPGFNARDYPSQFRVSREQGQKALDNIYNLLRRNEATNPPQQLHITISVRNRVSPRETKQTFGYRVFEPMLIGNVKCHFTPIWDNWSDAVDYSQWSDYMKRRLRWTPQLKKPCVNLRTALVNPDGTVRLCGCRVVGTDHDDMILGTVDDDKDALMAKANQIRDGFNDGRRPKVCQGCSFYNPE